MGASTVVEKNHGGTRKGAGRPPSDNRKDGTTRIDLRVLGHARVVCRDRGISLADYLSDILRGPVGKDFLAVMKKMESEGP